MIDVLQLKKYIIIPTLEALAPIAKNINNDVSVNLILGTAAVESNMGTYLHQHGGGPALGIYQMEPNTHQDIWDNYLRFRPTLHNRVKDFSFGHPEMDDENLIGNLYYATALCRIHYYRSAYPLPSKSNDIMGLARMWRLVYNTQLGAHTDDEAISKFCSKYRKYVLPYI